MQFAWIEGEDEATLLPFLKEHSIEGWLFHDPDHGTGRSYGLESPQPVIIGMNRKIVGFDREFLPSAETINAVLGSRTANTLSAEPQRMPRFEDHRPDFSPSYAVHIAPSKEDSGGNSSASDYWSLQGYTVKRLLAEMLDLNPILIELPASLDARARYDFSIVLPKDEDKETMRNLIRQGAEDYFHLSIIRENRSRDVYVLTASDPKLPAATGGAGAYFGFSSSSIEIGDSGDSVGDRPHSIDAMTGISMEGTVDDFCHMLEQNLDRPMVNETKLDGMFDFQIREPELASHELPKLDFVERLRKELGLVIAPAQRSVETIVYRQR